MLRSQFRKWWQHSKRIRGKKDAIGWLTRNAWQDRVGDVTERICSARIFRALGAVVIRHARDRINSRIFQHASKANRLENFRLGGQRKFDALGVAAAFNVEHTAVAPTMLVIAHQIAIWIRAESCLASTRKTKENSHILRIIAIHIGGAMHWKHAALRQVVIHGVENALLHFAGVARTNDHHFLALKALNNGHATSHAVLGWIGQLHGARVDDGPILLPPCKLTGFGVDEKCFGKERVPRLFREHADFAAILGVGAGVAVKAEQIAPLTQVIHGQCFKRVKILR